MNTQYTRVLPRDLFNESKLLKCIGRLCLLIHDNSTPVEMSFDDSGDPFEIGLTDDGSLAIVNVEIKIKDTPYLFKTTYNSKANYPLYVEHDSDHLVFDEKGKFDQEFVDFCATVSSSTTEATVISDIQRRLLR